MHSIEEDVMTVWLNKDEYSSLMFLTGSGGLYYLADNKEVENNLRYFMSKSDMKTFKKAQPEFVKFKRIK